MQQEQKTFLVNQGATNSQSMHKTDFRFRLDIDNFKSTCAE